MNYDEYVNKMLNDENYLQANRPQEYFQRMINGDFYTEEEKEIIAKRRNSISNDETSKYQVMGNVAEVQNINEEIKGD